ncbi:hypothetical protein BDA99DRAFT_526186 [Phascolomyces articulosus]|uniref:Uncharacterized protein n=1 Tax=Phascolomyces articulosus TaxID=60185 RepID=A0AAD5JP05_9FUNG|nr:hypothetical protein BDA99DRAFT_526186 [Phascolomyces articulosus]
MARLTTITMAMVMMVFLLFSFVSTTTAAGGNRCNCLCYYKAKFRYHECMRQGGTITDCVIQSDFGRCGPNCQEHVCNDDVPGGF